MSDQSAPVKQFPTSNFEESINPLKEYQRSMIHHHLKPYLTRNQRILDINCGSGQDFEFYRSLNLEIDAIESNKALYKKAQIHAQKIALKSRIAFSTLNNFIPDTQYDIIILNFGVINLLEPSKDLFLKLQGLLAENGKMIIVSRPPFHLYAFIRELGRFNFPYIYKRLLKKRLESLFHNNLKLYNGSDMALFFDIIRAFNIGPFLPEAQHFNSSAVARFWTKKWINSDRLLGSRMPYFMGGEYILWILKPST